MQSTVELQIRPLYGLFAFSSASASHVPGLAPGRLFLAPYAFSTVPVLSYSVRGAHLVVPIPPCPFRSTHSAIPAPRYSSGRSAAPILSCPFCSTRSIAAVPGERRPTSIPKPRAPARKARKTRPFSAHKLISKRFDILSLCNFRKSPAAASHSLRPVYIELQITIDLLGKYSFCNAFFLSK